MTCRLFLATVAIYFHPEPSAAVQKVEEFFSPVFALPWTSDEPVLEIRLPENVPAGYVIAALPATNLMTREMVTNLSLHGTFKDHFNIDPLTGMARQFFVGNAYVYDFI